MPQKERSSMKKITDNIVGGSIFSLLSVFIFYLLVSIGTYTVSASNNSELKVYFSNIRYNDTGIARISDDRLGIEFDCNLVNINDKFIVTFDVINEGEIDAVVDIFNLVGLNEKTDKFLNYFVTYEDGSKINPGDVLNSNTSQTIKLVVAYELDKNIEVHELPNENTKLDLGLQLDYAQKLD